MSGKTAVVVVYESMFGNTQRVAEAISEGLRSTLTVELLRVDQAPDVLPAEVQLLVVGGPTHAFSMSRSSTRGSASAQGTVVMPVETGIREWLGQLRHEDRAAVVATFDTRVAKARRLPGSAAKAAAKVLRRQGFTSLAGSASFYVDDSPGPLSEGELARARAWGRSLAAQVRPAETDSTDPTVDRRAK
jgi:hypothetical protein